MSRSVTVDAVGLGTLRYGETSKIVRLATRELGVQSAIAKGALRPKSRFGLALQPLSDGQAILLPARQSDLHQLISFDVHRIPTALAAAMERYAPALVLAELMLRFAPAAPHPESFAVLQTALEDLAEAGPEEAPLVGLRRAWEVVAALGHEPALDTCVVDGRPVPEGGPLPFSVQEGGSLCPRCARTYAAAMIPPEDRVVLRRLLAPDRGSMRSRLPPLDRPRMAAHRRLLARFIACQLGDDPPLTALHAWQHRTLEPA